MLRRHAKVRAAPTRVVSVARVDHPLVCAGAGLVATVPVARAGVIHAKVIASWIVTMSCVHIRIGQILMSLFPLRSDDVCVKGPFSRAVPSLVFFL